MLQHLAAPVWLGLVGIMAIGYLFARKVSGLAVFILVAMGVGILILNPTAFEHVVRSIGDAISRGV
jgi:hypothetical protein